MPPLMRQSDCLAAALGKRDAYTEAHCNLVESLSMQLGLLREIDADALVLLQAASRLHDIGKIGIPDHILLKPGRLEPAELAIMRSHVKLGQEICEKMPVEAAEQIGLLVRCHHEAFDGSGYPDGLSGEQIPLCARIISLADSYDAMFSTRPYQRARSHEQVMEIMKAERGKKSDPVLFDLFEQLMADAARPS